MSRGEDTKTSRGVTDSTLGVERDRANDEVIQRSTDLGEAADEVIVRARQRARAVLELSRHREDAALDAALAAGAVRDVLTQDRLVADDLTTLEYAHADSLVFDERSALRRAIIQMLAHEREETNRTLAFERRIADRLVAVRDDMLGSVSHDLRNLLSALLVRTSVVVLTHSHDAPLVDNVRGMQRSIAQMDNLLSDFLDVASMEAGRLRVTPARIDLAAVVAEEVDIHRPIAEARSINLTLETTPLDIEADAKRVSRVVLNLLANALKFTPEGGRIDVRVTRDGDEAVISVSDTGPGIAETELEAIFERFSRLDAQVQGYGLGLYISRALVSAMGGKILVTSKPGEGATFCIRLPAS